MARTAGVANRRSVFEQSPLRIRWPRAVLPCGTGAAGRIVKLTDNDIEELDNSNSIKIAFKILPWLFVLLMAAAIYVLIADVAGNLMKGMLDDIKGLKQVTAEHYVSANLIAYGRILVAFALAVCFGILFRVFPFQKDKQEKAEQKRSDVWLQALRIWCANAEKLSKLDPIAIEKFVDEALRPYDEEHKKELLGILLDIKESVETPQQPKKVCLTYEGNLKAISNKESPRYRAELQAAVDLWLSFEANPVPAGCSPKSEIAARLVDWQDENNEAFLDASRDRILKMVNWDKDGNKQKSK